MRVLLSSFVLALLTGCNTAGPYFRGLPATTITVDGSTFDVRVNGKLAEAIRTNVEYAPRFGLIRARAGKAMEMVSGCKVKELRGYQAQATGILNLSQLGTTAHEGCLDPQVRCPEDLYAVVARVQAIDIPG